MRLNLSKMMELESLPYLDVALYSNLMIELSVVRHLCVKYALDNSESICHFLGVITTNNFEWFSAFVFVIA